MRAVSVALGASLSLLACQGEPVAASPQDAAVSDAATTDATPTTDTSGTTDASATTDAPTGPCSPTPGELLRDPSFELWAGDAGVAWGGVTRLDGAAHCSSAARVDSPGYGGTQQHVAFNPPLPAGTTVKLRARAKYLSGVADHPGFLLYLKYVGVTQEQSVVRPFTQYPLDGTWSGENTATVVLEQPTENIVLWILSGDPEPQSFGVDDASMTTVPPDAGP